MTVNVRKLKRKIERLKAQRDALQTLHEGKEATVFNYYSGQSLGYFIGKVAALEDILDEIENTE